MNPAYVEGMEYLVSVVQQLSLARGLDDVVDIVRVAARRLTGADGATFVLREGDNCHYVDEDAIKPLWRGKRFPLSACISGWAMLHGRSVAIEDIYADERVPADAYRPTFVRSLVMVPIRTVQPLGAIGNYWATHHQAEPYELKLLESLAHSTAVAIANVGLVASLETAVDDAHTARDALQRQLELRDEFISAAAHELRTPLTTLQLQMEVLRRWLAAGEFAEHPREQDLIRCRALCQRQHVDMGRLADNMLDASRIRLGRFSLERSPSLDLAEILHEAAGMVATGERTPFEIELELGSARGRWDRARVKQMLAILLDNAVKFGEGRPVRVVASVADGQAHIEVHDHGIGIDPPDHQRIFQRFERAAPLSNFRGPGLGLFIARHIAEAHAGGLTVRSDRGKGSTFTATLPLD